MRTTKGSDLADAGHHCRFGPFVDLAGRSCTLALAGAVVEVSHAEVDGPAGLAGEALQGTDLARELAGTHEAKARQGVDQTGDLGITCQRGALLLQGFDPGAQLEELTETFRTVDDLELFEQLAVGQADGYSVLTATDIDANAQNTMVDRLGFRSAR